MKTFRQIIDEGYTYPPIIPQDLRGTIFTWFQDRVVADDTKFPIWFTRLLRNDYEQYHQLLRIEPGYAQYDWLVTQYHELQRQDTGTVTKEGSNTLSRSGSVSEVIAAEGGFTNEETGSATRTNTDRDITSTQIVEEENVSDVGSNSGTTTTDSDTETHGKSNVKELSRALPMQTTYNWSQATEVSDAYLDWSTATSQQGRGTTDESTAATDTSVSESSDQTYTSDRDKTRSDSTTVTRTDNETRANTKHNTNTHNDTTTKTGTNTVSDTGELSEDSESEALVREVMTGRNGEVAEILEKAKSFIETTNAWDWFKSRIETVFLGVYDI